jgi:hypothetical protein
MAPRRKHKHDHPINHTEKNKTKGSHQTQTKNTKLRMGEYSRVEIQIGRQQREIEREGEIEYTTKRNETERNVPCWYRDGIVWRV